MGGKATHGTARHPTQRSPWSATAACPTRGGGTVATGESAGVAPPSCSRVQLPVSCLYSHTSFVTPAEVKPPNKIAMLASTRTCGAMRHGCVVGGGECVEGVDMGGEGYPGCEVEEGERRLCDVGCVVCRTQAF